MTNRKIGRLIHLSEKSLDIEYRLIALISNYRRICNSDPEFIIINYKTQFPEAIEIFQGIEIIRRKWIQKDWYYLGVKC